ncbi:hypothetical protein I4U23_003702 [Adineta vaga]|nr:hypothetical protein I4U23_003702 [Adineta vaga]
MNKMVEEITLVSNRTPTQEDEEFSTTNTKINRKFFSSKKYLKQFILWMVMFICLLNIAGPLALRILYSVPTVKPRSISKNIFSEERALDYLHNLTQYGSRVSNTRGNFQARDYLISQIHRIYSMNKRNLRFQIELQNFTNLKQNQLQNILVRISNASQTYKKNIPSLLLSAHYDTVEFSSGSCDDGSGVVILLELVSNLVHDVTLTFSKMDLILLFTNGEESNLEGAKAFTTHHRWRSDFDYFINVDAASCREVAFLTETTRSQLVIDYSRVSRPRTNVVLELTSMWIPWASDYNVLYLNNTRLGYAFGFLLDSYTYHTVLDHSSEIKRGIIQDLGENLGILTRNLFREYVPMSKNVTEPDLLIYFDILGRYLMIYKLSTSILIQWVLIIMTIIMGIVLIIFDHIWHRKPTSSCNDPHCIYVYFKNPFLIRISSIIIYVIANIISIIVGLILSYIFAAVMTMIRPTAWNGNVTLAMYVFSLPYLIGFLSSEHLFDRLHRCILRKSSDNSTEINVKHSNKIHFNFEQNFSILLIYCLLMMISILFKYRIFYIILVWSIFICPTYLCAMIVDFILHSKQHQWTFLKQKSHWLYLPLIISLLPFTHTIAISDWLLRILMPIFLKMSLPALRLRTNIVISSVVITSTLFLALNLISVAQRIKYFGRILIVLLISLILICTFAVLRQPFNKAHPYIIYAKHTSKSFSRVEKLTNLPMNVPLKLQSTSITVKMRGGQHLPRLLDDFSVTINHPLQNKQCYNSTTCVFDDTFNRPMSIEQIRIESVDKNLMNYRIILRHVLSYNIQIASISDVRLIVRNQFNLPRTETIIDITSNSTFLASFHLDIHIRRCDITDSPFLLLFTQFISNGVLIGKGSCNAIDDHTELFVNKDEELSFFDFKG